MASSNPSGLESLKEHLLQHPSIKLSLAGTPEYDGARLCFLRRPAEMLAVVRPQTAEDVQTVIRACTKFGVEFVIRSGGHDCQGRTQVAGTLMVDMRDINYVEVDESRQTVRLGGGVLTRKMAKVLSEQGLVPAAGSTASVGYIGWCTLGGYGPFSGIFGPGVDGIVAAKVVDANGDLITASEELLTGIRGGGGIFGAIVELTVKVYPLKEILTGLLVFESSDMSAAWKAFTEKYVELQKNGTLPRPLYLQPLSVEMPGAGKIFAVAATWVDADQEEGRRWIDKVAAFGNCVMNTAAPTTLFDYTESNEKLFTYGSYGKVSSLSFRSFTPKTTEILAKHASLLPGNGTGISIHYMAAPAANENSVFGGRKEHHMLEVISISPDEEFAKKAMSWGQDFMQDLRENDPENILEGGYISLISEEEMTVQSIYGDHYEPLLALKKKYDPKNVFKHAIPRLQG